jgi:YD repeat-containing protein
VAERTEVMLLDARGRVIATTRPEHRFTQFPLNDNGQARGSYLDAAGNIVAFAKTLGYQEYDGLGWWGVVVQRAESEESIRVSLGMGRI